MQLIFDRELKYFALIGIAIFFLIVRESILIPLTHDEYSTIMVSYQPILDIITYKDPIPNNHILNTLFLKLNIITFGDHLFSNRLHNVLSFIPFYVFAVLLIRQLSSSLLIQLAFIGMLVLQPFLLDFFCVTRGYGLSVTFQVISLYYAITYLKTYHTHSLLKSILFAAIGVYANFTLLNYYIPLCMVLFYFSFTNPNQSNYKQTKIETLHFIWVSILLGLLCFLPFKQMVSTNQFVFWSSNNFFTDTIVPLFFSLRTGVTYFKWDAKIYGIVLISFVLLIAFIAIILRKQAFFKNKITVFACLLLLSVLVYNNAQFYLAKIPFLNARTSLFFVPIVALFFINVIIECQKYAKVFATYLSVFLIVLSVQHFARGYNGRVNFEWYYDQNTYKALDEINYLIHIHNMQKPVKVDCNWFYHPSLTYHINQKYRGVMELMPYHKETNPDSEAIIYYSEPNETEALNPKWERVKEFPGSYNYLWIKKEVPTLE